MLTLWRVATVAAGGDGGWMGGSAEEEVAGCGLWMREKMLAGEEGRGEGRAAAAAVAVAAASTVDCRRPNTPPEHQPCPSGSTHT